MAQCPDVFADRFGLAEPLIETVTAALVSLPSDCSRLWVALSGGCDSVTLLHCAARAVQRRRAQHPEMLLPQLYAVHVNHQLHSAATAFEQLCRSTCAAWGVPLHVARVDVSVNDTGGPEARAREARYAVFSQVLADGDALWMAHHADDQAETVLLRAMRCSGVTGMAGMPSTRTLGNGTLMRPLLRYQRKTLEAYADTHRLSWCDDPTNGSSLYDRNYIRHHVIPCLSERWPQAVAALTQVAAHARETNDVLNAVADRQLAQWPDAPQRLSVDILSAMSSGEARLIIRRALAQMSLPMPPRARLDTVLSQLSAERGHIQWPGAEIRVWQGSVYLAPNSGNTLHSSNETLSVSEVWQITPLSGKKAEPLRFAERQGGERLQLKGYHRSLKAVFQERRVPPWLRQRYCVAWCGDTPVALVATTDAIVADGWHAQRVDVPK